MIKETHREGVLVFVVEVGGLAASWLVVLAGEPRPEGTLLLGRGHAAVVVALAAVIDGGCVRGGRSVRDGFGFLGVRVLLRIGFLGI